eukprot:scaffold40052_cov18-Prasinocladus_malaysianus.AAC.1
MASGMGSLKGSLVVVIPGVQGGAVLDHQLAHLEMAAGSSNMQGGPHVSVRGPQQAMHHLLVFVLRLTDCLCTLNGALHCCSMQAGGVLASICRQRQYAEPSLRVRSLTAVYCSAPMPPTQMPSGPTNRHKLPGVKQSNQQHLSCPATRLESSRGQSPKHAHTATRKDISFCMQCLGIQQSLM